MIKELEEIGRDFLDSLWQHYIIWSFVLTAAFMGLNFELFWLYKEGEIFYTDTDCYTRAVRIVDWLQNFQWHEKIFPYFNPPHGFVLHFTRICDVIWVFFSLPFLLFLPVKDAVFYGGMFFSPFFLALTLISILWGLRSYMPMFHNYKKFFCILLFTSLFYLNKLSGIFDFCRPDHHSMMCFVFCFNLAVVLRTHIRHSIKEMLFAGILCGFGMWAASAIEGLFVVAMMLLVLSINWIFYKHTIQDLLYYSLGLFLSVTFAWLVNPPYGGWGVYDINRLSIIHAALTALIFLSFLILSRLSPQSVGRKIIYLGTAAALSGLSMLLLFGAENLFVSIYEPHVLEYFIPRVSEMKGFKHFTFETPSMVLGIILIVTFLYYSRAKQPYVINLAVFFVLTLSVAQCVNRFYPYYLGWFVMVSGLGLFLLLDAAERKFAYKWVALFYILIPFFYLAGFSVIPGHEKEPQFEGPVLVDLFRSPEILFWQDVDAVGSPYHTNVEGIIDNYNMWFTEDTEELKTLLKKHNVQMIYLPSKYAPIFYQYADKNLKKLYAKIMLNRDLYPWLEKVEDSLYRVNYDKF